MKVFYFFIATISIVCFYMLAITITSIYLKYRNDPARLIMIGMWVLTGGTTLSYLQRLGRMVFGKFIPYTISSNVWMISSIIDVIGIIIITSGVLWFGNWLREQRQV